MLKKKLMAVVAACALALALPTAAFAADGWSVSAGGWGVTTVNSVVDTTTDGYLYKATVNVTVPADKTGAITVSAPESALGQTVIMSGYAEGSAKIINNFGIRADLNDIPAGTGDIIISVVDPDYDAPEPTPTPGTDTPDPADTPAADATDNNGTAGSTDNAAADDNKAADKSKTSPKTGVDMGGVALATAGALAAAGCVAFALRKKIAINE